MSAVLKVERLRKNYGALRPLRIETLQVDPSARLAVLGIDAPAAETLVSLLTGAVLPDEGTVRVFGRETSTVTDPADWLATLDRFGILSVRAVLVGELTLAQNLAMAFTLSVDPIADAVMADVRRLAVEAGVPIEQLGQPLAAVTRETLARCHLARAVAADPSLLLLEHANALTTPADAPAFGRDIARVADGRRAAVLALTADDVFAHAVARRVRVLDVATGRLDAQGGWRSWFR
jgi:ABC-type transporter Mla maintaining outer membrane lipid asymmetry ATPase subunit MlaF